MQEAEMTVYTFEGESYAVELHRVGHGWRVGGLTRGHYIEARGLAADDALSQWQE